MTLPSPPSSISISQINAEYNLGNSLSAYRGVTWYKDDGSSGTFPSTSLDMGQFRSTRSTPPIIIVSISANVANYTFNPAKISGYIAGQTMARLTIAAGTYIYSTSTGTPALTISGWASGDQVSVVNSGYILGCGGNGGAGGRAYPTQSAGGAGGAGGTALSTSFAVSITNNGTIGGGGGGGGGGGSYVYSAASVFAPGAGGGGGAGFNGGSGGSGGQGYSYYGASGGSGTTTSGGSGGAGSGFGGSGGSGGNLGTAGGSGSTPTFGSSGGSGGAAGAAVVGNTNITWVAVGTRYGTIS